MRLAFMGSPEFSTSALRALVQAGHEIAAVYTQPPKPAGRGQRENFCAVHKLALELGLPVRTPKRLRNNIEEQKYFAGLDLDAAIVAAYGLILPAPILTAPRQGCINIHASLLPRWRGAAPIQAAILAGDRQTGITIMQMDAGLDTGPMLRAEPTPIGAADTAADLHDRLAEIGARLIVRALAENPPATQQPDKGATYAAKLTRDDGRIDWSHDAAQLDCQVRALNPWPGTFTQFAGETLKILAATPTDGAGAPGEILDAQFTVACAAGALRLDRVQRAGRPAIPGDAFLRGIHGGARPRLT